MRQDRPKRRRGADDLLEHRGAIDLFAQGEVLASNTVFGSLAVVDVGSGGIPADDVAVVVPNRVVADQNPAILSVFAARALLRFKRLTARECLPALVLEPRHIIRMETPDARVFVGHLFEAEPRVVEHEGIRAESTSVRAQDGDAVRNGVDSAPQLERGGLVELLTEEAVLALEQRVETRVLQRDGGLRRQQPEDPDTGRRKHGGSRAALEI